MYAIDPSGAQILVWRYGATGWELENPNARMFEAAGVDPTKVQAQSWINISLTDWYTGMPTSTYWYNIGPTLENYDELASTLTYSDTITYAGEISIFNQVFSYQSGIHCANC